MKESFSHRSKKRIKTLNQLVGVVWSASLIYFGVAFINCSIYEDLYLTCWVSYLMLGLLWIIRIGKKKIDLFEPLLMITALYVMMFYIVPMGDILIGQTLRHGVDNMPYGVVSTIYADIGYVVFFLTYNHNNDRGIENIIVDDGNLNKSKIARFAFFLWLAAEVIGLIYYVKNGRSLTYILTLGARGSVGNASLGFSAGFIGFTKYVMVPSWFLYFLYGKSNFLKIIMFYLVFGNFWQGGFRFVVVIMVWALITLLYLRSGKRPSVRMIAVIGICMVAGISVMGLFRNAIRSGTALPSFEAGYMWHTVTSNFEIYKTYYGVVKAVPELTPYIFGGQIIIYTLLMVVPRMIWPSKPLPPMSGLISYAVSDYAVTAGDAYPNLGEYYQAAGLVGIVICMFAWGVWNKYLVKRIRRKCTSVDLICFCLLYASNFQLFIRGYTPTNFYFLLLLYLPCWFVSRCSWFKSKSYLWNINGENSSVRSNSRYNCLQTE